MKLGASDLIQRGHEWLFSCVNPEHIDHHPSMNFNDQSLLWLCWSCGVKGRGYVALTQLALSCTEEEALNFLLALPLQPSSNKKDLFEKKDTVPPPAIPGSDLSNAAISFLRQRGYTAEFALKRGCKSLPTRLVIPLSQTWYTMRTFTNEKPKYLFPKGFPRREVLYNWDQVKHSAIVGVVEGVFDVWRVEQSGFPCVATLGASISLIQKEKLNQFREIVILPDQDEAGQRLVDQLGSAFPTRLFIASLPRRCKDADECTVEEIQQAWRRRRPYLDVISHVFQSGTPQYQRFRARILKVTRGRKDEEIFNKKP